MLSSNFKKRLGVLVTSSLITGLISVVPITTANAVLNALDGAISLNNVLIIITTNHIEKLDPALLRPGRIDVIKELGFAKTAEAEEYLSMFYLKDIKLDFDIETSMCNIQNV